MIELTRDLLYQKVADINTAVLKKSLDFSRVKFEYETDPTSPWWARSYKDGSVTHIVLQPQFPDEDMLELVLKQGMIQAYQLQIEEKDESIRGFTERFNEYAALYQNVVDESVIH